MSCSRVIIEQRLADLELALKRQEELISSQKDAIRNLRDLIFVDQQNTGHTNMSSVSDVVAHASSGMVPPHHMAPSSVGYSTNPMNTSNAYDASVHQMSLPFAATPMNLPRLSQSNNTSMMMMSPNTAMHNNTINSAHNASVLGQRSFAAYTNNNSNNSAVNNSQVDFQHSNNTSHFDHNQDVSVFSQTNSGGGGGGGGGSAFKRSRMEVLHNSNINTNNSSYTSHITSNYNLNASRVIPAPVAPPLKRRRAIDRIRQLTPLFSSLIHSSSSSTAPVIPASTTPAGSLHTTNTMSSHNAATYSSTTKQHTLTNATAAAAAAAAAAATTGTPKQPASTATLPVKTTTPSNATATATNTNTSVFKAPIAPTTTSTTTVATTSVPASQPTAVPLLSHASSKLVPSSLPVVQKGFNYGGVDLSATTAGTSTSTSSSSSKIVKPSTVSSSSIKDVSINNGSSSSNSSRPGSSNSNVVASSVSPAIIANNMKSTTATTTVNTSNSGKNVSMIDLTTENSNHNIANTAADSGTNVSTTVDGSKVAAAVQPPQTPSMITNTASNVDNIPAVSNRINTATVAAATSNSSSNNNHSNNNNAAAMTPLLLAKQMEDLSATANAHGTNSVRNKVDFLRALPVRLQQSAMLVNANATPMSPENAQKYLAQWFVQYQGKQQLLLWLKRLEEDCEELNIDGIALLELLLQYLGHKDMVVSKEDVLESRADKVLRRIYKKYSSQKLSLGNTLLESLRSLWSEYRSLYKEAAGDDATD